MAPTPTELLAEDVGSLRESDRQLTESIKTLTASVNDLRTEFAGFKGSIESDMRTIRWLGSFFAGILVVLVGSAITLSWQAAVLSTEVNVQGDRLDKVEQRLDKVDQRFDQLEKRMDKTDAKLDLIFQRIDQVIARPSPKPLPAETGPDRGITILLASTIPTSLGTEKGDIAQIDKCRTPFPADRITVDLRYVPWYCI